MEHTEQKTASAEFKISGNTLSHMHESAKWAHFLSIVGFIGIGLMFLVGIITMIAGSSVGRSEGAGLFFIYAIMAVLYFFPTYFLFLFATKFKAALNDNDQSNADIAIENLKNLFKFTGILTIVVLSLYILIIFGVVIALALQ